MNAMRPLLEIQNLAITITVAREPRLLVRDVSLSVSAGQALGVVGESGSGKSLTAKAVMRLLPDRSLVGGRVLVDGRDVLTMPRKDLGRLRRREIAMIHQDPRSAMNPVRTIGDFLSEGVRDRPAEERRQLAVDALAEVGIPDADRRFVQYPHQLSGGLLQRVMIAGVLMPGPRLILADEPTTALDVTTQSEVMAVLSDLQHRRGVGMVFITHDLDLAAAVTDNLGVMYAGSIVEIGPTASVQTAPLHPYTVALMTSRPSTTNVEPLKTIPGRPVAAYEVGAGCSFAPRCPFAQALCREEAPELQHIGDHKVACHRAKELAGHIEEKLEVLS